ncbi:fungal-specific transcription factor domain-containing protein [Echria macrotheca]|uniref:Fungal-specific transcription factor domain-containing protein n=1 Tax=Echria macrotheca TaxID=438768 RepID=A0AAJ0BP84_9PEZI|nr:fungal-specific transcription factor domain-containing protein [Echria macrotheca]
MSYLTFQGPSLVLQSATYAGRPYPGLQEPAPLTGMPTPIDDGGDSSAPGRPETERRSEEQATKAQQQQPTKRSRVLLSCAPCRFSKLKCDRQQPCTMCLKKGRVDMCTYAPKPEKPVPPPRTMTARLKRLEAMVRGMMDGGGPEDGEGLPSVSRKERYERGDGSGSGSDSPTGEDTHAQVVFGRSTTYVGATHFMAMLDDIEDLKSYFDHDGAEDDRLAPQESPVPTDTDLLLMSTSAPITKRDIIDSLPSREVVDRLAARHFSASSPTQPIVHAPTFWKEYDEFWKDPYNVSHEWLALLLMVLALGAFFSIYVAPHEVQGPDGSPSMEPYRRFRSAAAWALVAAKYTFPCQTKMQAYLIYTAAEFMTNRGSSGNCYVLSSIGIRLMLQMGLHREPSKLPNISPFDGEMRRRMWHLAVQIELLVSFHMGLPSMLDGLETDVLPQANLTDEDLSPDMTGLPPSRPDSESTQMTYSRWKSAICVHFGKIAAQANSISVPAYGEVMRLDRELEETWSKVPSFMKVKPFQESLHDPPARIHQRFGLASLYQKARCVLHRRYLMEPILKKEHAYSRRACLEAAVAILEYQDIIHLATLPGGVLRQHGWYLAAIATYDFLIAAMIIFVLHQSQTYEDDEAYSSMAGSGGKRMPQPSKDELVGMLRNSHQIWVTVSKDAPATKKAGDILEAMLKRIDRAEEAGGQQVQPGGTMEQQRAMIIEWQQHIAPANNGSWQSVFNGGPSLPNEAAAAGGIPSGMNAPSWLGYSMGGNGVDWVSKQRGLGSFPNYANGLGL